MTSRYAETYASWRSDAERFWADAAEAVDWIRAPDRIFAAESGPYGHWFPDALCNTCHNAVDRHVEAGRGEVTAILYDSPVAGLQRRITYAALLEEVATLGAVLESHGVGPGDRVVIYMPMVPEALVGMLACARIGAIHSVVFGGFAPSELAKRIDDARPKLVLTASCGLEPSRVVAYKPLLDAAIALALQGPEHVIVLQRPAVAAALEPGRDLDWDEAMAEARGAGRRAACATLAATDPLYILYTSGTTGVPKGVVRDNGGHMVALLWTMRHLYGIAPDDTWWTASDIGWIVGHSYIVYAPLLLGATTLLYEGKPVGTPDAGAFWRVIAEHKVAAFFTAPTALRAVKKEDPDGKLAQGRDLSSLRSLFLAGERADPPSVRWAEQLLGVPVIDHWWQTETGWAIAGNPIGLGALPIKYGSPTVPMPGYEVHVLDDNGAVLPPGQMGSLAVRLPLPPGNLPTLWQQDARMHDSYLSDFPGYYKTADAGYIDPDGYLFIMGRTDDIINVAGHRLSTGGMEEVLASHPDVAECAVIGRADEIKGEVPLGFLVLKAGARRSPAEIEAETVDLVRSRIGPVAAFKTAITVDRLPKTRSGKILRGTMKKIADGEPWRMPATIEDAAVLDEIGAAVASRS